LFLRVIGLNVVLVVFLMDTLCASDIIVGEEFIMFFGLLRNCWFLKLMEGFRVFDVFNLCLGNLLLDAKFNLFFVKGFSVVKIRFLVGL